MKNHPFYQNGFLEGFKKGTEQERLRLKKEIEKKFVTQMPKIKGGVYYDLIWKRDVLALLDDTPQKEEVKND